MVPAMFYRDDAYRPAQSKSAALFCRARVLRTGPASQAEHCTLFTVDCQLVLKTQATPWQHQLRCTTCRHPQPGCMAHLGFSKDITKSLMSL